MIVILLVLLATAIGGAAMVFRSKNQGYVELQKQNIAQREKLDQLSRELATIKDTARLKGLSDAEALHQLTHPGSAPPSPAGTR